MAGANTGVYEFHSKVRAFHIFKAIWTPPTDEKLQVHNAERHHCTTWCVFGTRCVYEPDLNTNKYSIGVL